MKLIAVQPSPSSCYFFVQAFSSLFYSETRSFTLCSFLRATQDMPKNPSKSEALYTILLLAVFILLQLEKYENSFCVTSKHVKLRSPILKRYFISSC